VVENPLPEPIAVEGTIKFYAAGHRPAGTHGFTIPYLSPGARAAWADTLEAPTGAPPAAMEVTLRPAGPGVAGSEAIAVQVTQVTPALPSVATMLLINHNAEQVSAVRLNVVAFGQDGSVLGGASKLVPELAAHLDTQIVVSLPGVVTPSRVEVYPSFTASTRFGDERTHEPGISSALFGGVAGWVQ
jgi:hypothetical protein